MVTGQVEGGLDKGWICSILGRFYFQKLLKFLFKHSLKYSSLLRLEKLALLPVQAGLSHWVRPSCPVIFFSERSGCLSARPPHEGSALCPQPQNILLWELCSET